MNNLLMEVENEIAVVTINRPKSLNALNSETLAELNTCLAEIEGRTDIKVVILTGSGSKSFVAGADISEMVNATPAEGRAMGLLTAAMGLATPVGIAIGGVLAEAMGVAPFFIVDGLACLTLGLVLYLPKSVRALDAG